MGAFSGCNRILIAEEDKKKTLLKTEIGTYYYKLMPIGLKNEGTTYELLINNIFKYQVGRNMEVYIDEMLVTSTREIDHTEDLL